MAETLTPARSYIVMVGRATHHRTNLRISAELPDKNEDRWTMWRTEQTLCLYETWIFSKQLPKKFVFETVTGEDGYMKYRRRPKTFD